ncbi:MAG: hypothetical protein ACT4UQ_02750 [Gammaproteobacteria bacterium]
MKMTDIRLWAAFAAVLQLPGCGLLPDRATGCEKPQPYQSAEEATQLKVPAGADLPDTRNALRIPAVRAPERPAEPGRCLDFPPDYAGARPPGG